MAEAGADVLVPHMGLTTKGTIGAKTAMTLDECVERVQAMRDAAKRGRTRTSSCSATAARSPSPRTPRTSSSDTEGIVGFFGASSMERLPTEIAMTENMRRFKAIPVSRA